MANIPGIVFQEPGGSGASREKTPAAEKAQALTDAAPTTEAAVEAAVSSEDAGVEAVGETSPNQRRGTSRKSQAQTFPVHVVKPHPLAFERAQEIIEANDSYTKILPGDEPGTVIVR